MILSVNNIECRSGSSVILDDVSFTVESGSLTGIIGPNGSGKTTLFNCLSGFSTLSKGKIYFENVDITAITPDKRALKGLGRVFQNFGVFRDQTVLENILVALESRDTFLSSFFPNPDRNRKYRGRALQFLSEVKLDPNANQKAGSLSGGQMRLLEIIRSLAFGATVFLLDEPTAGVSPIMKDDIIQIVQRLKALGKTVLIIEHDMNFIQSFAERIIVMNSGTVFMDDAPHKVMHDPRLQDLYFGKKMGSEF